MSLAVSTPVELHPEVLVELAAARMPFGRYAGRRLLELPEEYLVWLKGRGWPAGKLGAQLAAALEIKHNGLTGLLDPLAPKR